MNPGLQTAGSKSQQLSITFWVLYTRICSRKFGDRSCSRRWGGGQASCSGSVCARMRDVQSNLHKLPLLDRACYRVDLVHVLIV